MTTFRPYNSENSLYLTAGREQTNGTKYLLETKSEPNLKYHPLLNYSDDFTPISYGDLILAGETLENIVNEGTFIGTIKSKLRTSTGTTSGSNREMNSKVLKLVYGTMKCNSLCFTIVLPYIDTILVKTQFLVFNNQVCNYLYLFNISF
jgi:hypothetical protein